MIDFNKIKVLTFDCYGTLTDWETGIINTLMPVLISRGINASVEDVLQQYAGLEAELEEQDYLPYRDILKIVCDSIFAHYGIESPAANILADSVGNWMLFDDTNESMKVLKHKFKLGLISNIDKCLLEKTLRQFNFEFDFIVTAEDVKSYKPSHLNFRTALYRSGFPAEEAVHVAQSLYHDISPANSIGIRAVWINSRHGR